MRTLLQRVLPPPGPLRGYSAISVMDAWGSGVFVTGSAAYFVYYIGLSAGRVGLGLTIAGLIGLLASLPAGMLGDRYGHRRVLITINAVRAAAFLVYVFVGGFWQFLAVVTAVALAECAEPPNRRAYLSLISAKETRVKANAYNRAVWNVGFALGAACSGLILAGGTHRLYTLLPLANSVSYAVAALVLLRLPREPRGDRPAAAGVKSRNALRNWPFMSNAVAVSLLYAHTQLLSIGLPLWIVQRTSAPRAVLAPVMLVNTVLVVLLQVRLSKGTDTAVGSARLARRAGLALCAACVVWALTGGRGAVLTSVLLMAGMVLATMGEILCSAAGWGISYALAPADRQGEFMGAWSLVVQFVQALGPALFAAPLIGVGAAAWMALAAVFLLVGVTTVPLVAWSERRLCVPAPAAPEVPAVAGA